MIPGKVGAMPSMRLFFSAVLALSAPACTTLTSGPDWVGGTLAEGAPERFAREEAELKRQADAVIAEPKEVGAKHILVMHKDSERKPPEIARSREEARARAEEVKAKIKAGESFDDLVLKYSDEPGAAERKGDVGVFEKKVMVKAFADAAFRLKIGEVSDIVETPFGFHIIMRTQ